jgi:hypothetical protein
LTSDGEAARAEVAEDRSDGWIAVHLRRADRRAVARRPMQERGQLAGRIATARACRGAARA